MNALRKWLVFGSAAAVVLALFGGTPAAALGAAVLVVLWYLN